MDKSSSTNRLLTILIISVFLLICVVITGILVFGLNQGGDEIEFPENTIKKEINLREEEEESNKQKLVKCLDDTKLRYLDAIEASCSGDLNDCVTSEEMRFVEKLWDEEKEKCYVLYG